MTAREIRPVFQAITACSTRRPWNPATISKRGQRGHGHPLHQRPGQQHDQGHEQADEDVAPARLGPCAHDQRRARDRPAGRNAADQAGCHVGSTLAQEVARHAGIAAVGVGRALADACALHQADDGDGQGRQQQRQDERQLGQHQLGQLTRDGRNAADRRDRGEVGGRGQRRQAQHSQQRRSPRRWR